MLNEKQMEEIAERAAETAAAAVAEMDGAPSQKAPGTPSAPADPDGHTPAFAFSAMTRHAVEGPGHVRVKSINERFSIKREPMLTKAGQPAQLFGRPAELPSAWDRAKASELIRHVARKGGLSVAYQAADSEILAMMAAEDRWSGEVDGVYQTGIAPDRIKALLNDTASGGAYASPDWFDSQIIAPSLLYGELVPFVDHVEVSRGATVDGAAISHPALTWGSSEGSAFNLVTTTGLISDFDTSLFSLVAGIEFGNDFAADTGFDLGTKLTTMLAEKLQAELDMVVAVGNGTTQPTGIFTAAGVTVVTFGNGTDGPYTVGDAERLMFGVGKQYRTAPHRPAFITSDTGYRRLRSVPIATTDARRVFGMDHSAYQLFDYPCRINNSISAGSVGFGDMSSYRLYKRAGMELRLVQDGETLARKNTSLLVLRSRWGGKPALAAAFCKLTDGAMTG